MHSQRSRIGSEVNCGNEKVLKYSVVDMSLNPCRNKHNSALVPYRVLSSIATHDQRLGAVTAEALSGGSVLVQNTLNKDYGPKRVCAQIRTNEW